MNKWINKTLDLLKEAENELYIGEIAERLNVKSGSKKYNRIQSALKKLSSEGKISRRKLSREIEDKRGVKSTRKVWHYRLEGKKEEKMKDFVDTLRENIEGYSGAHSEIIQLAPEIFEMFQTLSEKEVLDSNTEKLVNSVISYFVLPYDALPESELGPFGYVDDLYLCAYVIDNLKQEKEKLIRSCWKGKGDIFKISSQIIEEVKKSQVDSVDEALLEEVLHHVELKDRSIKPKEVEERIEPQVSEERICQKCGKPLDPSSHPWTKYCENCAEEVRDTSRDIVTEIKKNLRNV